MPSNIASLGELARRLDAAITALDALAERHPANEAIGDVRAQLARLRASAEEMALPQAVKAELDFGQLASRHLHALDPALAGELYEIASFVVYGGEIA